MKNSVKSLRPKANSLIDLSTFLHAEDIPKNQVLGNALSELMKKGSFPPPVQKFFELPKFKELILRIREGTLDGALLDSKEILSLQLLLESFHKLVHLDFDFEEIEHPVVQAKVLEQNIQDYLSCISLFFPYEGKIINDILSDLFQTVHFFTDKLKTTILENEIYFSNELIVFMQSEVISLIVTLERSNYLNFKMEEWHPIAIELNIDAKLAIKKNELSSLAKGNAHKIINQLQTVIADMSHIYLRNLPHDIAKSIKTNVLIALSEYGEDEKLSGQKVNELFYLEFWKETYAILLTKEKRYLTKLRSHSNLLVPMKMSLFELINDYGFVLPKTFSNYFNLMVKPSEFILSILGRPNLIGAELSIGFFNTQYEYLNEILSSPDHEKVPYTCNEKLNLLLPTLISFLETYYTAKPLTSLTTLKERLENSYEGPAALQHYSIQEINQGISLALSEFIQPENPPLDLLGSTLNKITTELRSVLGDVNPKSIEHRVLQEKLFSLENVDLPSFAETWHTLGEVLGLIFIYFSQHQNGFLENLESSLKILFSPRFFRVLFEEK